MGFLSEIHLGSASLAPSAENPQSADWVETCKCTEGFVGQFCESCAPGYKRALKFGGPLTKCIKCECHGHSDSCDAESGIFRNTITFFAFRCMHLPTQHCRRYLWALRSRLLRRRTKWNRIWLQEMRLSWRRALHFVERWRHFLHGMSRRLYRQKVVIGFGLFK